MTEQSDYFDRAVDWADDRRTSFLRSRRAGWFFAAAMTLTTCLQGLALVILMPLKSVQLTTLLVDRQTGFVQAVEPGTPRRLAADEVLTQSFLAQYVTAREGFDRATVKFDYRKTALFSIGQARARYLADIQPSNPESPFSQLASGVVVATRVKSISLVNKGTAFVRFDTQQQSADGDIAPARPWIALIRYVYTDTPMDLDDRLINPLSFKVMSYRRSAEAAPPETHVLETTRQPLPAPQPARLTAGPPSAHRNQQTRRSTRYTQLRDMTSATNPIMRSDLTDEERAHIPSGSPLVSNREQ